MNFLNKMERKYGRYAIRNLSAYMIGVYVVGYMLYFFFPNILAWLTLEPYYILHGQIWRLVTWLLIPPQSPDLFTIIMLFFYYSIGTSLEHTWGAFRYNVYIFMGVISTVIGAFILYFILCAISGGAGTFGSSLFSTYYINMSIFLAFAASYPNERVLLYFFIPVKMKWMGYLYGFFIVYSFFTSSWVGKVAILASLLNFIVYFLMTRDYRRMSPHEFKRKQDFKRATAQPRSSKNKTITKHKCAVCGRTELDGDNLEFRFCSKCDGNYEYCQDHLFTHEHIRKH